MIVRFFFLLYVGLALLVLPAVAHAGNEEQAGKYIQSLADETLQIIQSNNARDQKKKKLESLFSSNVDIKWVGRFVMGRYWRKASKEQKQRYLHAYEDFVLGHYASRFTQYTSGEFVITDTSQQGEDGEYMVSMELLNSDGNSGQPVLVDYRVRKHGNRFLVFDVIIEGVSMITTQRSEFSSVIARNDIDYLIKQLASKSMPLPDA